MSELTPPPAANEPTIEDPLDGTPGPPIGGPAPAGTPMAERLRATARSMVVPVLGIFTSLVIGGLLIWLTAPEAGFAGALDAIQSLVTGSVGSRSAFAETLVNAVPLCFAGLSVALAFQAGLFNIGAFGQIVSGTVAAAFVATNLVLPAIIHLPLAVIAGFLGGALWGGIVGLLKARTGAHEVITTIMLNFVAVRTADFLLTTSTFQREGRNDPISKIVAESARLPKITDRLSWSLLLAIAAIVLVAFFLNRTTGGFRVRSVGANSHAATYAGMGVGATWILSMSLAGGLSGLAGASNLLGVEYTFSGVFPNIGFDAIALALLGRARPVGVAAAAVLFGALRTGAVAMQASTQTPIDIIVVVQGLVIVFVAAPALVRALYRVKDTGDQGLGLNLGWGS